MGVEGEGFEPTLDALFGERGFFPEAVSNSMYNSGAYKVPKVLRGILDRLAPDGNRMKRQVTWYQGPVITPSVAVLRFTVSFFHLVVKCYIAFKRRLLSSASRFQTCVVTC